MLLLCPGDGLPHGFLAGGLPAPLVAARGLSLHKCVFFMMPLAWGHAERASHNREQARLPIFPVPGATCGISLAFLGLSGSKSSL